MNERAKKWLAKAYPITAEEIAESDASDLELIDHSITKWRHLQRTYIKEHGLHFGSRSVYDSDDSFVMAVGGDSCALCERHCAPREGLERCATCPLAQSRGGSPCDVPKAEDDGFSPWQKWVFKRDPKPMIKALKEARKFVLKQQR